MTSPILHFPGVAQLSHWIGNIVQKYETVKNTVLTASGVDDWFLHANGGLLIMALTAAITRRSLGSPVPMLVVGVLEILNESFDRLAYASWRWHDTSRDISFTLLWPVILFVLFGTGIIRKN